MPKFDSLYERLVAHTHVPEDQSEANGCWVHDGPLSRPTYGYPTITRRIEGKHCRCYAHREMFTIVYGPVPEGHEVDHLCYTHRCINPGHLRALPLVANRQRNQYSRLR